MISPTLALVSIPDALRKPLIDCYSEIGRNFAEHRWEPAELNGGKFSEVVHTILVGALTGTYAARPSKPANMVEACRSLEALPTSATRPGDRSLRILIPRMLPVLYEIRNNRGVGHVGGEIDPNYQDSVAVFQMASWILAELVRIFHQIPLSEAQVVVNGLVERKNPIIWQDGDIRRVLDSSLSKRDQTLLLLYSVGGWCAERDLVRWVEYTNSTQYRSRILVQLHSARIAEYDRKNGRIKLTPIGGAEVENRILLAYKV